VSVLTNVFLAYWNPTIFTGIGLAHMMSMMNCLIECSLWQTVEARHNRVEEGV
jgi:hypothetical protein